MNDMQSDAELIADVLAGRAVTGFEMGETEEQVRDAVLKQWRALGSPAGAISAAVLALPRLPQPPSESAENAERLDTIMRSLGGVTTADQLAAAVHGLAVLQELALQYDDADDHGGGA